MPNKSKGKRTASMSSADYSPRRKLLRRFYEPLVLLAVLDVTRGEQKPIAWPKFSDLQAWPIKYVRRLLLKELAFVCDYDTGGDSVTAMGLEGSPHGRTLWVASNTSPEKKIVPFLQQLIEDLRLASRSSNESIEPLVDRIAHECIDFGSTRVKAYRDLMRKRTESVADILKQKTRQDKTLIPLIPWLEKFCDRERTHYDVCKAAFTSFDCSEMKLLENLCIEPNFNSDRDAPHRRFRLVRHYMGRLGHHHKASRALVISASRLSGIFDSLEVRALEPPSRSPPPLANTKETFDQMLVRMCPSDSKDFPHWKKRLSDMDSLFNLRARFQDACDDKNFQPRVHAEVQILDHFYQNMLNFEDMDAYIACSKPACYCCSLYFKYHPLQPELPATHQRIYYKWRPPDQDGRTPNLQRDVLNLMIKDIRLDLFDELDGRHPKVSWHPDSTTGISAGLELLVEEDRLWQDLPETTDDFERLYHHHPDETSLCGSSQQADEDAAVSKGSTPDAEIDSRFDQSSSKVVTSAESCWSLSSSGSDGGVAL